MRGGGGQRGSGRGGPAERAAGQQVAGDIDAEAGAEGARRAPQEGTGRKFNWAIFWGDFLGHFGPFLMLTVHGYSSSQRRTFVDIKV